MAEKISKYFRLVKFSHTIFAMPFALMAFVYALWSTEAEFSWWLLLQVVLCMVFARNVAMGFNRWADRKFDAENPRTANREIPSGAISPRNALIFVIVAMLTMICINTQIIRQKKIQLKNLEQKKEQLMEQSEEIQRRIEAARSEETIRQYAVENGILLPQN